MDIEKLPETTTHTSISHARMFKLQLFMSVEGFGHIFIPGFESKNQARQTGIFLMIANPKVIMFEVWELLQNMAWVKV